MTQTNPYQQNPKFFCLGNLKPGSQPQVGESKRSAENFGHFILPFDLAQGGELVEPFRISDFVFRIYSHVIGNGKAKNYRLAQRTRFPILK
jgi:hypothetical protein